MPRRDGWWRVVSGPRRSDFRDVAPETSRRMKRVRRKDTRAELIVRAQANGLGLRYRTLNRDLPGSPDLANRSRRWVLFVHGCFWHAHLDCPRARVPVSNGRFWEMKFAANRARDAAAIRALRGRGFRVAVVWECELTRLPLVRRRLRRLLPDT